MPGCWRSERGAFLAGRLASLRVPRGALRAPLPGLGRNRPDAPTSILTALGLHGSPRLTALLSSAPGLRGHGALALAPWRGLRATVA